MPNKLSVTELAKLSNLSKAYISQVKAGRRPPLSRLFDALCEHNNKKPGKDYLALFLRSRKSIGVSPSTLKYYRERLSKFKSSVDYLKAKRQNIENYLNTIPSNQYGLAIRHASYRTIKTF